MKPGRRALRPQGSGALLVVVLFLVGCAPSAPALTTVSGKTVYRGMGVEGAVVQALGRSDGAWVAVASVKSGYHGSFSLRLPPGSYFLHARTDLPTDRGTILLVGKTSGINASAETSRLDQVLILLQPAGGGGQDGPPRGAPAPP